MAKKQDAYYFETFTACLDDACKAAQLLDRSMREFDPAQIKETLDEMHNIEHAADDKKHELLNVLAKAFITPIEREDIILLSQNIDEVTDKIEDVLLRVYCNNVQKIRPEALEGPAGPHHPHQHPGGGGRPAVHQQHAHPPHHLHRPHRDHRLAGDLPLSGEVRGRLRARGRHGGERGHEEFLIG